MTVHSPKTARHAGHESRVVPIFPELRPYLEAVFDEAEPGTERVIARRNSDANLRTQLKRIIQKAGLTPWPRITHNLRASRATELAADHPAHVAAEWLGHSTLVAQKHYWTVTDSDFEKATKSGAECGALGAQKAAQRAHVTNCSNPHKPSATPVTGDTLRLPSRRNLLLKKDLTEVHGNRTHRS